MSLGRQDLAGKTGTTNDHIDAWFAGFQPTLVAVAWIGFDTPAPLGANETGGQAALPMWMTYMAKVLKGVPETRARTAGGHRRGQHQPGDGDARARRAAARRSSSSTRSRCRRRRRRRRRARCRHAARRSEEPDLLGREARTAVGRNRSRRDDNLRRHLAYLAARLMAEDGVADYATPSRRRPGRRGWPTPRPSRQPRDRGGAARVPGPVPERRPAGAAAPAARGRGEGDARVRRFPPDAGRARC